MESLEQRPCVVVYAEKVEVVEEAGVAVTLATVPILEATLA